MILFLDFDGVLHPAAQAAEQPLFCRLPLLEDWLRQQAHVEVVISSSWREVMELDDLREIFSADLRHRIIDKCPVIAHEPPYWRHAEILAWIEAQKYPGPWLALDDIPSAFPESCDQVVFCEPAIGVEAATMVMLSSKLGLV